MVENITHIINNCIDLASNYSAYIEYLLPSLFFAIVIQYLAKKHPIFFILRFAGTITHELAHIFAGFVTFAKPVSMTLIPQRTATGWNLGMASFNNLRWYNSVLVAMAPVILIFIPIGVAVYRVSPGFQFEILDFFLIFLLAPQFLSCWPSKMDWIIGLRSWPIFVTAGVVWYVKGQFLGF